MGALSKFMAGWTGKLLFAGLAILVPALGVWVGSSIAALQNGPIWLVMLVGLLAFPLAPLAWDFWAMRRRERARPGRERILTTFDRIVLRTLVLNLVLVGGLVGTRPGIVFEALSTRGDWMLDDVEAPWADSARDALHLAADRLEWLHTALHPNAYDDLVDHSGDDVEVDAVEDDALDSLRDKFRRALEADKEHDTDADTDHGTEAPPEPVDPFSDSQWPFRGELHPAVASIPPEAETSIESVAKYIAAAEPDRTKRIKALHDYVADRVAYDVPSYRAHRYPPQDAETVFKTHLSVCAGYANLLAALGEAAGEEIVVVTGDARDRNGGLSGEGHAWNAAKLDDRWVLLDATWDAGYVDAKGFTKKYGTTYLMSPPEVFGVTHFPEDDKWQLRETPITRGDFVRQPHLRGNFFAYGLRLRHPDRSQTTVEDSLSVTIDNPGGYQLNVYFADRDDEGPFSQLCSARSGGEFRCDFATAGDYRVAFFGPDGYMGDLQVNATG